MGTQSTWGHFDTCLSPLTFNMKSFALVLALVAVAVAKPDFEACPGFEDNTFDHPSKMAVSKIRTNFHPNSEALINKQINMELHASYVYMSMAAYFDRDDVALHGFAKRFREDSDEEREHAEKFIKYQNMRGGRVVFQDIAKAKTDDWNSALSAIEASLELEKKVHESLLEMHKVAGSHGDAQLTDFIEGEYLKEQVEAQKEIGDLITKMKRAGDALGLHIIDKELQ